jgi:hypothetical protein
MENDTIQIDHSARAHATFGPSSLKYYAICGGYHGKDGTSAASEKGTRIHEALEVRNPDTLLDEDEVSIYEQIIKEEDELIAMVLGDRTFIAHREVRLKVEVDAASPTFGTCDLLLRSGTRALMVDYKTGVSKIDEPRANWQAKAYTLATFQTYPEIEEIVFAFIVPQNGGTIVGQFERSEMQTLRDEISGVIQHAEAVRPKWDNGTIDLDDLMPSFSCRYCRHEEHCPALGAVCIDIARRYRPDLIPLGPIAAHEADDPENLGRLYQVAKIVESWAGGIKNKATVMALGGQEFEDLRLKSMGALKKTIEKNYLAELAMRYGLTLPEVIEAADLTLNQLAESLHNKTSRGKKKLVVDSFTAEAIELGLVEVGPTRYTLTSQ